MPACNLLNHCQRSYAYRLLSLLNKHLSKEILLASLRVGDGGFQPGELPNDTLIWAKNARSTLYGQWLAWQLIIEHSIDPANGGEPFLVTTPDFYCKRKIIIQHKKKALQEAKKDRTGLVFWTDGSKLEQGNTGAAVCSRDEKFDRWKNRTSYLGKNKEVLDVELWAISEALILATKETRNTKIPITVFCNSQKAFTAIQHTPLQRKNRYIRSLICNKARELQEKEH